LKKLIDWKGIIFWSNQFYAIAAVLLTIESYLKFYHQFPTWPIMACVYLITLLYYTQAYLMEGSNIHCEERFNWYQRHKKYLYTRQLIGLLLAVYLSFQYLPLFKLFSPLNFRINIFIGLTGLMAILYYLPICKIFGSVIIFSLKKIQAWFKSITIAWVWVVVTFLTPLLLETDYTYSNQVFTVSNFLLACQNLLFVLLLAILFDIKDKSADIQINRNTIATVYTYQFITNWLVPFLLLLNFSLIIILYIISSISFNYLLSQIFIGFLILFVSKKLNQLKSIEHHILCIDGILYIKAILGILFVKL